MAGLDVERVLTETDPTRQMIDIAVVQKYLDEAALHREDIANRLASKF